MSIERAWPRLGQAWSLVDEQEDNVDADDPTRLLETVVLVEPPVVKVQDIYTDEARELPLEVLVDKYGRDPFHDDDVAPDDPPGLDDFLISANDAGVVELWCSVADDCRWAVPLAVDGKVEGLDDLVERVRQHAAEHLANGDYEL